MKQPVPADITSSGRSQSGRASLRLAHASSRSIRSAHEAANPESLGRLATLLAAHAPYDGRFALRVPGLYVVRRSRPTRGLERATVLPALCIVAQGAKTVMLGREVYSYDASRLSPYAQNVVAAMKKYGLVLADNGSAWYFQGEQNAAWPDRLIEDLKTIPASAFVAVDTSSLMVSKNSGQVR